MTKTKKEIKERKEFFKILSMRTLATFGYLFFSSLIASRILEIEKIMFVFYTAFIGSGLYFFSELIKYYGVQPDKKVLSKTNKYIFIL